MTSPFISICIPAYKRINYLKRLLSSIEIQSFTNFEVIISDDSDDNSVQELLKQYNDKFTVFYFKNEKALGTPANWNHAISKAKGEWIKLIHDDDWFAEANSLEKFAHLTKSNSKFIISAYANYYEATKELDKVVFPIASKKGILNNPLLLLAKNIIGPPSVTLFHCSIKEKYDERLKWRVDMEYYIRIIEQEKDFVFINEPLVNVGISESQVTNSCLNIPAVEIPEIFILLSKYGTSSLRNIFVFDAYWRILRNTNIKSTEQLESFGQKAWPVVIVNMVKVQSKFSGPLLRIGLVSKTVMAFSYLHNLIKSNF
jgi:glycosyltransferase involved in cell wall biosynthesis